MTDELPPEADIRPADLLGNVRVRQLFDELLRWREAMIASDQAHGRDIAALRGQHDLLAARVSELERQLAREASDEEHPSTEAA